MIKNDKRQQIMDSAIELISKRGYNGTTTKEIARIAGVAELTIFRYFGSKEKLFEDILATMSFNNRFIEIMPEIEQLNCKEGLIKIGTYLFDFLKKNKPLVTIMVTEINNFPLSTRKLHCENIDGVINRLSLYIKSRLCPMKQDSYVVARAFLGMLFGYFQFEEIIKERDVDEEEISYYVNGFVNIIINE
ncbi:MAG: TetR/AcrR family transcriptional regulator [Candidatus Magnetoovum sp. WYHC-5]|nr:TetR/AcrR family transcriptional regulator [Candidatus Magnetoovum sp. WYHC-5]